MRSDYRHADGSAVAFAATPKAFDSNSPWRIYAYAT